MTEIGIVNPEAEQAMLRAQERAKMFVSVASTPPATSTVVSSTPPVQQQRSSLSASPAPRVKSSLKLRPALNRTISEPMRKSVHFSTTHLCDIRQFKGTQKPCLVSRSADRPKFFFKGSEEDGDDTRNNEESDEDDSEDDLEDDRDISLSESYQGKIHDFMSASRGLDEDEFDEDGISRIPKLKTRNRHSHKNKAGGSSVIDRNDVSNVSNSSSVVKGWTMLTPGFVPHSNVRVPGELRPNVYLENLQYDEKKTEIKATVFARNISFCKSVVIRYSINSWKSLSEAQGTWSDDIRKFDRENNFDRFDVVIPLNLYSADLINSSTLEMCVRYNVNGAEYWDNNGGKNYSVFLRNQKLSKTNIYSTQSRIKEEKPEIGTASKAAPTRRSPVYESFQMKPRTFSEPKISLDPIHGDHAPESHPLAVGSHDSTYGSHVNNSLESIKLSATDFFSQNGLPHKTSNDISFKNPFTYRYSFNASFNGIESENSKHKDGDDVVSPYEGNRCSISPTSSKTDEIGDKNVKQMRKISISFPYHPLPENVVAKKEEKVAPLQTKAHIGGPVQHTTGSSQTNNSWESESYKEFVSRYCFYTPQSKNSKSNSTSKYIPGQTNGTPSTATAAALEE